MKNSIFLLLLLVLIPVWAGAVVFEKNKCISENVAPGITLANLNAAAVRVNGKKVVIKRYESREPVKKILDACLEKAEARKSRLVNNRYLWLAASTLFRAAGSGVEPGSFGYIFMIDKNDTAVFIIAGASGDVTEIIKSETADYSDVSKGGYDDGLNHYPGAERVLSIELLSEGRAVNFGNFYLIRNSGRHEIRNYYEAEFKKKGLAVLKSDYMEEADRYILKSGKRELLFNINGQEYGEAIIFLMG